MTRKALKKAAEPVRPSALHDPITGVPGDSAAPMPNPLDTGAKGEAPVPKDDKDADT